MRAGTSGYLHPVYGARQGRAQVRQGFAHGGVPKGELKGALQVPARLVEAAARS
jgi:hypothetical protein